MQKAIIGKKIGMTQIFDENGKVIPVTVVEAGPCTIVQKKTVENDGYAAVQMGYGDVKPQRLNKPEKGHFAKADVAPKKTLKEFRLDNSDALNVGDVVKADTFAVGDSVDVSGTSKGKGFAGAIKRHNQHRLKETHGTGPVHRQAGSMGACSSPSRAPSRDMASPEDLWLTVLNIIVMQVPTALAPIRARFSKENICQVTWVQKQLPCRIWKSLRLTLKIISSQSRVRSRARRAASLPSLTA